MIGVILKTIYRLKSTLYCIIGKKYVQAEILQDLVGENTRLTSIIAIIITTTITMMMMMEIEHNPKCTFRF